MQQIFSLLTGLRKVQLRQKHTGVACVLALLLISLGVFSPIGGAQTSMVQVPYVTTVMGIPSSSYTGTPVGTPCTSGTTGYIGSSPTANGCPGTQGLLQYPYGVAVDSSGDLVVAQAGNYGLAVLYEGGATMSNLLTHALPGITFTPTVGHEYIVTTAFSSGNPLALQTGGVYWCGNASAHGTALDSNGDGCAAQYDYVLPRQVAIDPEGSIFFSQLGPAPTCIRVLYAGGTRAANLINAYNPTVASGGGPKIGYIYALSTQSSTAGSLDFITPRGIAVMPVSSTQENLFVSDNGASASETGMDATTSGSQIKEFVCPVGTTGCNTSVNGNTYSATGWATYIAGSQTYGADGDGGLPSAATVYAPQELMADKYGDLFFMDTTTGRLRVVYNGGTTLPLFNYVTAAPSPVVGHVYSVAGGGVGITSPAAVNTLALTSSIFGLDPAGNLYFMSGNMLWVENANSSTGQAVAFGFGGGSATYFSANTSPAAGASCNGSSSPITGPTMTDAYADGCPASQVGFKSLENGIIPFDQQGNFYIIDARTTSIAAGVLRKYSYGNNFGTQTVNSSTTAAYAFTPSISGGGTTYTPTLSFGLSDFTDAGSDVCTTETGAVSTQTCVENVTFKPSLAGARKGSMSLTQSATALDTALLSGIGTGPQLSVDPATSSTIGTGLTPAGVGVDQSSNFYIASGTAVYKSTSGGAPASFATGLSSPAQVAVDGTGNVYVADSGNNRIATVSSAGGTATVFLGGTFVLTSTSATPNTVSSTSLSGPTGVAVDQSGNIYVADTGNSRVIEVVTSAAHSGVQNVLLGFSGLSSPKSIAVDAAGDVFVADSGNSRIVELSAAGVQSTVSISPSLSNPVGIALDAAGDLYIADSGNTNVVVVPTGSSTATTLLSNAALSTFGSSLTGIASDSAGNLYVADSSIDGALVLNRAAGATDNFGSLTYGNAATVQTVTFTNTGNASLSVTAISAGTGNTSDFTFVANSCSATPITLATSGSECTYTGDFNLTGKTDTGSLSDAFTLASTAVNTAAATYTLAGTGNAPSLPSQTITYTGSTTATYGVGTITLSATGGGSGNAVVFTYVSGPGSVSGTNGTTLSITGAGSIVVDANQAGNSSYAAATQLPITISVSAETPTIIWSPSVITQVYGSAIGSGVLDATSPAGTITYTSNISTGTCGTAVTSSCVLLVGSYTLTANSPATTNYNATTSNITYTVSKATPAAISWSPSTTTQTYGSVIGSAVLDATESSTAGTIAYTSNVSVGSCGTAVTASCLLNAGTYTLTATFSPSDTTDYNTQTATSSYTVSKATQTITGFSPTSTYTFGTGTITLSSTGGGSGNSVVYTVDGSSTATGSISGTTLTVTGVGSLVIDANQTGNSNYSAATQVQATITVSKASQTISFTQPSSPVSYGVSPIALSAGSTSSLTVTFSVLSGPGTITGGTNLTVTGAGTIVVAADQAGSANYNAATEVTHSVTVNKASTTTSVASSSYSILPGASVTLTATVSAGTGTVSFYDSATLLGTSSLSGTTATLSSGPLAVGTHSITAAYNNDSNYAGSTSSAISVSAAYASSTTTLSCTPTSVVPGQPTTCTATVTGAGATPTGTVTFSATSDGQSHGTLGTGTLNGSGVTTYYGLIWQGNDSMTATYNGNSTYGSSLSNAIALTNFSNTGKLQFNWPYINWAQGQTYGTSSGAWPVTLQNLTGQTVTPTIGIANSNFVISGSTCGTLVQGATCSFNVTFTPTSGGSPSGTSITSALTATTSTPSQDASINVTGIALSSALTFNWPFLNFTPTVSVGVTSSPWPVTVTNSSGTSTTVNSIGFTDASFAVTSDTCTGQTLTAGATCTFGVTFSPIAADITQSGNNTISGTMTVSGNSGAVTGTLSVGGWAAAALDFNWPFLTFQNQPIGSTGTNLWPVTVTNYSGQALTGMTYSFTNVSNYVSGAFTLTNTCSTLAAGASCAFDVAPSPQSGQTAAAYSATLAVSGTTAGSVTLSTPALSVSGVAIAGGYSINWNQDQQGGVSTIDFGPQNTQNVTAGPWPITVYNNTGSTHTLTVTPSLGVFTTDSSTCTNVASGSSCSFNLYFTPTADQGYTGTLTVSDGTNSYTFNTWGGANK